MDNRSIFRKAYDDMFPNGDAEWIQMRERPLEVQQQLNKWKMEYGKDYVSYHTTSWSEFDKDLVTHVFVAFKDYPTKCRYMFN